MADLFALASLLTEGCSVSGYESGQQSAVEKIASEYFDGFYRDPAGSYILTKNATAPGLPRIMLDAHMDEVGMMVTQVLDGGFLRVTNIGGLDTRILQAADVTIYGKEKLSGVIVSTPPHLQTGDRTVLPKVTELLVDTGLSKEKAESLIPIGTPVGYRFKLTRLKNNRICGKGFDDKICAVAEIQAVETLIKSGYKGEITLLLSTKEEVSRAVVGAAYRVMPDCAIVIDVCGAWYPSSKSKNKIRLGDGPVISLSAITDVNFTKQIINFAKDNGYKHNVVVEASNTGTNANDIPLVGCGIRTALISIPLLNMHTYSEVISLDDVASTAELVAGFVSGYSISSAEGGNGNSGKENG